MHPGGVNMAMGDGSVSFVPETIDYYVFNATGSKGAADDGHWFRHGTYWRRR